MCAEMKYLTDGSHFNNLANIKQSDIIFFTDSERVK